MKSKSYYPLVNDAFIPISDEEFLALQEKKIKRNKHWLRMRRARVLWIEETNQIGSNFGFISAGFWIWLETNYGLIPQKDSAGNITEGFDIKDEKLYTLFLLKFG